MCSIALRGGSLLFGLAVAKRLVGESGIRGRCGRGQETSLMALHWSTAIRPTSMRRNAPEGSCGVTLIGRENLLVRGRGGSRGAWGLRGRATIGREQPRERGWSIAKVVGLISRLAGRRQV